MGTHKPVFFLHHTALQRTETVKKPGLWDFYA